MDQPNFTTANFNFSSPGFCQPSWNRKGLVSAVVFSFCFLLGVPGNIAVILLKPNWKHLSSLSQSLMLNLTLSDLICLLTIPLWIYNLIFGWTFGLVACKVLAYLVYCTVYCSQLTVTVLSIQRYLVVVRGWRCHQVQKSVLLVLLWLTAAILCIHAVVTEQLVTDDQWIRCRPHYSSETEWVAVLVIENLYGLVTFSLIAFSYICLYKKVNRAAFFNNPQTNRLVIGIIVSNCILFAPLHVINVLGVLAISIKNYNLLKFCIDNWNTAKCLTFVNSSLNPFLYVFMSTTICPFCLNKELLQQDEIIPQTPDVATIAEL
ncbi:C-C chemokine receptor type 8-like [Girardinichthys multiradiatus]|uniref:C-C chemokine receptor type 8-like n=1 Tax=Girardinichthys multiradiatus TaxID=208333 RepID=UPI001FAE5C78|nr:C-C chemokine receptor type 8-like [Girardinichthys multiradiatus]